MSTTSRVGRALATVALVTGSTLALTAFGTAQAATPAATPTAQLSAAEQPPPPPPSRAFREKFKNERDCLGRGDRDFPGQRDVRWDCRPGPDPEFPWEFWSD